MSSMAVMIFRFRRFITPVTYVDKVLIKLIGIHAALTERHE